MMNRFQTALTILTCAATQRCATGPLRVLLSPCGHVSLCEACAPSTKECPYCFKAIEKRERVEGRGL